MPVKVQVTQTGFEKSIADGAKRAGRNLKLDLGTSAKSVSSLEQPLGRITGKADEFTKSMEAANARVLAFGASVGILNSVIQSFKELVSTTIEVEKNLASINSILKTNASGLQTLSDQIFDIARNTEQTFETVSEAALELSRQGLTAVEVTKRLNDALILSRLSGLSAADAVSGLTAAVNSFSEAGLTTGEVLNKISNAANQFAVSERDLIEGFKRSASVAQQAGVSIDELGGIITAVQQRTARGGAVIGNSFKTIFTRIGRAQNLELLESLGVQISDVEGKILPATKLLQGLAGELKNLNDIEVRSVTEKIGGGFQIAPLLAALADYSSENSLAIAATEAFANATDEAYTKNEALSKTLSSAINGVTLDIKQLAVVLGEIGVTDTLRNILDFFSGLAGKIREVLEGEGLGSTFARGIVKGISSVISGPGLAVFGLIVAKLSKDLLVFGGKSISGFLTGFIKVNEQAKQTKLVQDQIIQTLLGDRNIRNDILNIQNSSKTTEEAKLKTAAYFTTALKEQLSLYEKIRQAAAGAAPGVASSAAKAGRTTTSAPRFADGYLPMDQERSDISKGVGGAPRDSKAVVLPNFAFGGGRKGTVVANSSEYIVPNYANGGSAIFNQDMVKSMGLPSGAKKINASGGLIPNFAAAPRISKVPRKTQSKKTSGFKGIYDSDYLTGSNKASVLNAVLSTNAKKDLLVAPAGAGKTTYAKKSGGQIIKSLAEVKKFKQFLILSGAAKAKNSLFSAPFEKILASVKASGGDVEYLYLPNDVIDERRRGRVGSGTDDQRSQAQLEGSSYAKKNQPDFMRGLGRAGASFTRGSYAGGYIPNFAHTLGKNKDSISIRSVTSPLNKSGGRKRGTGAVKLAIIDAIGKAKKSGFSKISADIISTSSLGAFKKYFGTAKRGKNVWDISQFKNASRGYIPNFARQQFQFKTAPKFSAEYNRIKDSGQDTSKFLSDARDAKVSFNPNTKAGIILSGGAAVKKTNKKTTATPENLVIDTQGRYGIAAIGEAAKSNVSGKPRLENSQTTLSKDGKSGFLKSPLAKKFAKEGYKKVTFKNLQIGSLSAKGGKSSLDQSRDAINKLFVKPLQSYSKELLGQTFQGNDVSNSVQRVDSAAKKSARIFSTAVEGGIFESAVALSTKGVTEMNAFLGGGDEGEKAPFDFEESGGAVSKKFIDLFQFNQKGTKPLKRADGKRTAGSKQIQSLIKKAFNDPTEQKFLVSEEKKQPRRRVSLPNAKASGYIPNFARTGTALEEAVQREKDAGVPVNQIRLNQSGKLRNSANPQGLAVTNTRDEPTGAIPQNAARGYVRNFVDKRKTNEFSSGFGGMIKRSEKDQEKYNKALKKGTEEQKKSTVASKGQNKAIKDNSGRLFGLSAGMYALQAGIGSAADETEGFKKNMVKATEGFGQFLTTLILVNSLGISLKTKGKGSIPLAASTATRSKLKEFGSKITNSKTVQNKGFGSATLGKIGNSLTGGSKQPGQLPLLGRVLPRVVGSFARLIPLLGIAVLSYQALNVAVTALGGDLSLWRKQLFEGLSGPDKAAKNSLESFAANVAKANEKISKVVLEGKGAGVNFAQQSSEQFLKRERAKRFGVKLKEGEALTKEQEFLSSTRQSKEGIKFKDPTRTESIEREKSGILGFLSPLLPKAADTETVEVFQNTEVKADADTRNLAKEAVQKLQDSINLGITSLFTSKEFKSFGDLSKQTNIDKLLKEGRERLTVAQIERLEEIQNDLVAQIVNQPGQAESLQANANRKIGRTFDIPLNKTKELEKENQLISRQALASAKIVTLLREQKIELSSRLNLLKTEEEFQKELENSLSRVSTLKKAQNRIDLADIDFQKKKTQELIKISEKTLADDKFLKRDTSENKVTNEFNDARAAQRFFDITKSVRDLLEENGRLTEKDYKDLQKKYELNKKTVDLLKTQLTIGESKLTTEEALSQLKRSNLDLIKLERKEEEKSLKIRDRALTSATRAIDLRKEGLSLKDEIEINRINLGAAGSGSRGQNSALQRTQEVQRAALTRAQEDAVSKASEALVLSVVKKFRAAGAGELDTGTTSRLQSAASLAASSPTDANKQALKTILDEVGGEIEKNLTDQKALALTEKKEALDILIAESKNMTSFTSANGQFASSVKEFANIVKNGPQLTELSREKTNKTFALDANIQERKRLEQERGSLFPSGENRRETESSLTQQQKSIRTKRAADIVAQIGKIDAKIAQAQQAIQVINDKSTSLLPQKSPSETSPEEEKSILENNKRIEKLIAERAGLDSQITKAEKNTVGKQGGGLPSIQFGDEADKFSSTVENAGLQTKKSLGDLDIALKNSGLALTTFGNLVRNALNALEDTIETNTFNIATSADPSQIVNSALGNIGAKTTQELSASGSSGAEALRGGNEAEFSAKKELDLIKAKDTAQRRSIEFEYKKRIKILSLRNQLVSASAAETEEILKQIAAIESYEGTLGQRIANSIGTDAKGAADNLNQTIVEGAVNFRDALVSGISEAVKGGQSLKTTLLEAATSFLQKIAEANIENAIGRITNAFSPAGNTEGGGGFGGFVGGVGDYVAGLFGLKNPRGFASGGKINGGSGTKDDVPAMLMGGEYVMRKSSVDKYGSGVMEMLNKGAIPKFAVGGSVQNQEDYLANLPKQNGDGGFFIPGTQGKGTIKGQGNLLNYATQAFTSGKNDVITGSSNKFGSRSKIDLETESVRLTNFGRNSGTQAQQQLKASKGQALNLFQRSVQQDEEYKIEKKRRKKAFWDSLINAAIGAVVSAGVNAAANGAANAGAEYDATVPIAEQTKLGRFGAQTKGVFTGARIPGGGGQNYGGLVNVVNSRGNVTASNIQAYQASQGVTRNVFQSDVSGSNLSGSNIRSASERPNISSYADFNDVSRLRPINRATGGSIPQASGVDTVPSMLSGGEFVVNSSAANRIGANRLNDLNSGSDSEDSKNSDSYSKEVIDKLQELIESNTGKVGDISITVNSDGSGETQQGGEDSEDTDKKDQSRMAKIIKAQVLQVIDEEQRMGGKLRRKL